MAKHKNNTVFNTAAWVLITLLATAIMSSSVFAKDKKPKKEAEAKSLSGISIVGNKEAPKSLFIVPWKSSEIGVENSLSSSLLNEKMKPVDKEVFERELDFYSISVVE
ncbi:MAG: hypothetical protein OEZ68_06785 [Gammaproteobacteria bacterium]|nr:hypothetical protein [Gammaproteobacteria bacterium]MDH5800495.1 hypothetical protein [Gammaproteobacteria bacterium]